MFSNNYTVEEKDNAYVFYLDADTLKPVMLYFLGYDRMFGSHYDEYVIQYNSFTEDISDGSIFNVPDGKFQLLIFINITIFRFKV